MKGILGVERLRESNIETFRYRKKRNLPQRNLIQTGAKRIRFPKLELLLDSEMILGLLPNYFEPKNKREKYIVYIHKEIRQRVLRKIYYSPQSKDSISLEVAVETKLFPDSALGNSLCNSGNKTKSEKPLSFFSSPPVPLEIELLPPGLT